MFRHLALLWFAALLLFGGALHAQNRTHPMTNSDVVKLVKGGLPESAIISAIGEQSTQFDISPSALVKLSHQGVSPGILNAMLAAARRQASAPVAPRAAPVQTGPPQVAVPGRPNPASYRPPPPVGGINDILGSWQGAYFVYPQVIRIDLVLQKAPSAAGNSVAGTFHFRTLVADPHSLTGTFQGSYQVTGTYDPSTQSFVLTPGRWIERPSQLANLLKMSGVIDSRTGMAAGTFLQPMTSNSGVMYFVLSRADRAPQRVLNPMKRAWEDSQPNRPHPITQSYLSRFRFPVGTSGIPLIKPHGADIHKIANWASRLTSEYPNINLNSTYALAIPAQNLFEDSYFSANFGKTFDSMSGDERHKFALGLRVYSNRNPEETELKRKYQFLSRYFDGFNVPNIVLGVLAQRVLRSWRDETLQRLHSLSGRQPLADFNQVEAMDKVTAQDLANLWPSERADVSRQMDAGRRRFAGPALRASAQQTIQSASGYKGAVALASWKSNEQTILKWADGTEAKEDSSLVQSKLNQVLETLMVAELHKLQSIGGGLDGLSKDRAWMLNFKNRYSRFASLAPVSSTLKKAQLARAQELKQSQAVLLQKIDSQKTVQGLDHATSSYLLQDDIQSTAGRVLWAYAGERREAMVKQEMALQVRESKAEALGVSVSMLGKLPPDKAGGPDVGEIYDAIERRIEGYNQGMKSTISQCKGGGDIQNDPTLVMACIGLFPAVLSNNRFNYTMSITKLVKIGTCVNLAPGGYPGYRCDYIIGLSQSNPIMTGWLGSLLRSGQLTEARFVKSQFGWLLVPPEN